MNQSLSRWIAVRTAFVAVPLALLAASATPAFAGDDSGSAPHASRYERLLSRFDANHDGVLETSELPPKLQTELAKADANGDGRITADELHAFRAARRAEHFAKIDTNGDGKIEPSEVSPERWERIKVADQNGDGAVSREELAQAWKSGAIRPPSAEEIFAHFDPNHTGAIDVASLPPHVRHRLGRADANQDGKITLDELKAFRAAHAGPAHDAGEQGDL